MPKPRPLGNNARRAIEEVDDKLDDIRRTLLTALMELFNGDTNAAGRAVADALEDTAQAARITTLVSSGDIEAAVQFIEELNQRKRS